MTDHTACCCTETLTALGALKAAYDEAIRAFALALRERDLARDTAARLEAELARGFRTAAPDITSRSSRAR